MLKYGYFDVKPEIDKESWQVNTDDFVVEAQTDLDVTPKKLMCIYMDDKEMVNSNGTAIFLGHVSGNGYYNTVHNTGGRAESVSFLSPDAQFVRYDEGTGELYLHVLQWNVIKCGKWMWIAIYDE